MADPEESQGGIDDEGGDDESLVLSAEDLIAQGLRPAQSSEQGQQDEGDELEDQGVDDAGQGAEPPPSSAAQAQQQSVRITPENWAQELRTNPARINEIPVKDRERALREAFTSQDTAAVAAINQARDEERQRIERQRTLEAAVGEIDQLREEDPEAFDEWEQNFPDRAAAYHQFKANQGKADPVAEAIATAAAPIMAKLQANPRAHALVTERDRQNPGRYAPTPQGLANLTLDVAEALMLSANPPQEDVKAQQKLDERRNQQQIRASRPHIDATDGRRGEPVLPNDPRELIAAGWKKDRESRRNGRG